LKKCKRCEEDVSISDYTVKNKVKAKSGKVIQYYASYCNSCRRIFGAESRLQHPQSWIATRYKIPQKDALVWYEKTKESCEICGIRWEEGQDKLCLDHDHNTGKIRGVLCKHCNHVLGHAYDSINTLESAVFYLRRTGG
jgi:hypothetical protein